jgi:hypothetical protein
MTRIKNEGIYEATVYRVTVWFKSGKVLEYEDVKEISTLECEDGIVYLHIAYETASFTDYIYIPESNIDYFHFSVPKLKGE